MDAPTAASRPPVDTKLGGNTFSGPTKGDITEQVPDEDECVAMPASYCFPKNFPRFISTLLGVCSEPVS